MSPVATFAFDRRLVNGTGDSLDIGPHQAVLLDIWIILYSIAQVLLLLLLCTMLFAKSQQERRKPTLINMILCGFFSTITPCILYYSGEVHNPNPPTGLCLTQATLKHGTSTMFLISLLALVMDIALCTREAIQLHRGRKRLREIIFLVCPYITFFAWATPVAVLGALNLEDVERVEHLFYCSLNNDVYGVISTAFGIIVIFMTMIFEIWTISMLRRSWAAVRDLRTSKVIDLSLFIRVGVFTSLEIIFVIITIIDVFPIPLDVATTIFEAVVYIVLFVLFGLRPDFIRIWMFWHNKKANQLRPVGSVDSNPSLAFRTPSQPSKLESQSSFSSV